VCATFGSQLARQALPYEKADGRMRKHHQVREGQIVRIINGPLAGFRGEVKEVNEQTAKVAVQVFGRDTPMDLALGQIELVPEDSD
jgi:transcription antitermination factor NusG